MTTLPVFIFSQYASSTPVGYRAGVGRRARADRAGDGAQPRRAPHRPHLRPRQGTLSRGPEEGTMAKSIDVSDLNIYYGDFLAVEGVNMTVKSQVGDRVHRPVRAAASRPCCGR